MLYHRADPDDLPEATWHLVLAIHKASFGDDRDKLPADEWVIRLLVGADDGDARAYDVHVAWSADTRDPLDLYQEVLDRLHVERVDASELPA